MASDAVLRASGIAGIAQKEPLQNQFSLLTFLGAAFWRMLMTTLDPQNLISLPAGSPSANRLRQTAEAYRDNHEWVPLRLGGEKGKSPEIMGKGWRKRTLSDPIPEFRNGDNIGVLLGTPSGGMVRLDPDFPSIPAVTKILFPEPSARFGRKSSPGSGRLLICEVKTTNFKLPDTMRDDARLPQHDGNPNLTVFQILSTGAQTVVPPSLHWESEEEVVWETETQLATLNSKVLLQRVGIEAFCMVVRQFWPARGSRNEAAMALARVLLRGNPRQRR